MATSVRRVIRSITHLAPGEAVSRLSSVTVVIFLGHVYGVVVLGVYSLAVTISQYLQPIIDFGLRHIGARLVAQRPDLAGEIVRRVQHRRIKMAAATLPFIAIYVVAVKLPPPMKIFLLAFCLPSALYAISLDWAAWGKNHLHLVGFAKAAVPISILIFLFAGRGNTTQALWWIVVGNVFGYVALATVFWLWWKKHQPGELAGVDGQKFLDESLAWRRTSIMGLAWLSNLAFNSIDMLMLGLMSNPEQLGLYSAAYRVLNQVLVSYYLLTQSLYPELSRQDLAQRRRMLRPKILLTLLGAGVAIAIVVAAARQPLMTLLFGRRFIAAGHLLFLLAWAIPLDFLTSYLGNAYIAWGMEKSILLCTVIGAASNILLNLIWIPIYGAAAAAINTLISYVIFLLSLALVGRAAKELTREAPEVPELAS